MLHDRIVSGFDIEFLFGEPCFTALLRAGLRAALGSDGAVDLSQYGTVARDDRFLHIRLSTVELHAGGPQGDVTIHLRLGLGPSAMEAGLGRRAAEAASAPTPQPQPAMKSAPIQPKAPPRPASRPMPVPQGPSAPASKPSPRPTAGPLPETHIAWKLRVRGEGATIVVESGVVGRALIAVGTWLTQQIDGQVGLAATAWLEQTTRSFSYVVPGLDHAARVAWRWLAGEGATRPALALLVNLPLDLRVHAGDPRPSPMQRGDPAAARSHLPADVAIRAAISAAAVARVQRAAFWGLPSQIGEASLRRLDLLLRPANPGYVDIRIEFEIELPGLNGTLAYQVPVIPRVVAGAFKWDVGAVARSTDALVDAWSAVYSGLLVLPNLFGADFTWPSTYLRRGSDELGNGLAGALAPVSAALPRTLEVLRVGDHAATLSLQATAVAVDAGGLSFHLSVAPA